MNITVRNEYRVEAELTADELKIYGITYEQFDYKNIETRRVLWSLLDEIRRLYGISLSLSGKLLIEVIKESEEKYRICFSSLPPHGNDLKSVKQLIKSENTPVVAEFCCFEDVLSAALNTECYDSCSLFEKNGKYRLIFYVPSKEKTELLGKICEFAELPENPSLEKARCEEMWKCIITEDAVKKLISAFSKS
ncbi:MAG: adaptor protein MecA [Clostridia bacterium]|nr:adaptor protein MecA [Clostridia bacterium]